MHWKTQSSSLYMLILLAVGLLWSATTIDAQTYVAPGEVSGTVYLDHNANGIRDLSEEGIEGVEVVATDETGYATSVVSDANGGYSFSEASDGLSGYVRIEFLLPADGSFEGLTVAPGGGTTTQFVNITTGAADIDAGFYIPSQSCGGDPLLITSCFVFGDQFTGANADGAVSVALPFGISGINPPKQMMVPAHQMGSAYGIAVQNANQRVFASSYVKTHTGLGPGAEPDTTTTGGIYEIIRDDSGNFASAELLLDLNALGFDTGDDPHPKPEDVCEGQAEQGETNLNCWMHDIETYPLVGKIGLGDMDFSADQTLLYVTNLNTKQLIELPVGNPAAAPDAGDIVAYDIPYDSCADDDGVPFGLGADKDAMYVGVTCTAESSRERDDLKAIVYRFDRVDGPGTEIFEEVLSIDLTYSRKGELTSWCQREFGGIVKTNSMITLLGSKPCPTDWHVWTNDFDDFAFTQIDAGQFWTPIAPQPMLSDIDFDGANMLVAFRDRTADQFGNRVGNPTDPTDPQLYEGVSAGDLLRACSQGDGEYVLEADGVCGGVPGGSTTNQEGPGIGEYYLDERVIGEDYHQELFMGAIVQIDGYSEVASTATAPIAFNEAGIGNWNNLDGTQQTHARLYQTASRETFFGKANGLGDLEAICALPSLELGNRVWCDGDGDGIQSPNEAGIPLLTVTLDCGEGEVTTRTDLSGHYLFTDLKYASELDGALIPRSAECAISIDYDGATGEEIGAFCGFGDETLLTTANADGDTSNDPLRDLRDSDAELEGTLALIAIDTGEAGINNHTLDIGFTSNQVDAAPTPVPATPVPVPTAETYDEEAEANANVAVANVDEGAVEIDEAADDETVGEDSEAEVDTSEDAAADDSTDSAESTDAEGENSAETIETPATGDSRDTAVRVAAGAGILGALGLWGWRRRSG